MQQARNSGIFAPSYLQGEAEGLPPAAVPVYDGRAVDAACAALAMSVANGNRHQFDSLVVALRTMMPPATGAERELGPPEEAILEREDFIWQEHHFLGGPEENLRVLQGYEAEYCLRAAATKDGFRDPRLLCATLDLAVAYIKNYALDKADALYQAIESHCMQRGLPWDVKVLQDMATLRCKQMRQQDAAVLLEEVAARTPPHTATLRNLGTVYNQLGQFEKARGYFEAAAELSNDEKEGKDDLWNLGIVKKNTGDYAGAAPMLEAALEAWYRDDPGDDVTLAKLHDTVGSCYDLMGRHEDAVSQFSQARRLFGRSVGDESPLYGSACEGLAKSLIHAKRFEEGFDMLVEAFTVHALKDAIHPTPLFELLGIALEDVVHKGGLPPDTLGKLEGPIHTAVKNMAFRGIDQDANAGVLFERMAQALLRCGMNQGDAREMAIAARRRAFATKLLTRASPMVAEATRTGLADLTHISALINMQLQVLATQDAQYREMGGKEIELDDELEFVDEPTFA